MSQTILFETELGRTLRTQNRIPEAIRTSAVVYRSATNGQIFRGTAVYVTVGGEEKLAQVSLLAESTYQNRQSHYRR
jgi:hypothetical protein